ncbi:MAG: hypothetical protein ACI4TG_02475 [Ruminococcus sp.]
MKKEIKNVLTASVFAASLMVGALPFTAAPVRAEESTDASTIPLLGEEDTLTTTTTSALGSDVTTETTTTTVPVPVVTVNAKLRASFNGDNVDLPSTDVVISSDNQADSYQISCMLADDAITVDYIYLDFTLPDATQSIRTLCPDFKVTATQVFTGMDMTTEMTYTMADAAVNYDYTDAAGNKGVRITLCDAASTGDGYLAKDAKITDNLKVVFTVSGLEAADPNTTTTTTTGTETTTTVNVNGAYDTSGKGSSSYSVGSSNTSNTSTPTQTADLSVGAIVVGAAAAISLAGAAFTITRRKKK